MNAYWKAALAVCGLGAIGAFVFFTLYKQWLSLPIFSQLTSDQTFIIMLVFLGLVFLALVVMLVTYYATTTQPTAPQKLLPDPPSTLPNGTPFPVAQRDPFTQVWRSLVALEQAGQELWESVSDQTLSAFRNKLREAKRRVRDHALFFSEKDYKAIEDLLKAANFYLDGKTTLSEIRDEIMARPGQSDRIEDETFEKQIQQNKRWLTRYKNLLAGIRSSLHTTVVL